MTQSFAKNIYWEPTVRRVPCSHKFTIQRGRQILDKSSPKWLFDYSCEEWLRGEEWGVVRGLLPGSGSSARLLWEKQYLRHLQWWLTWRKEKKRDRRGERYSRERPVCAKASSQKERTYWGRSRRPIWPECGQLQGWEWGGVQGPAEGKGWGYLWSCSQKHHLTVKQLPLKSKFCWLGSQKIFI